MLAELLETGLLWPRPPQGLSESPDWNTLFSLWIVVGIERSGEGDLASFKLFFDCLKGFLAPLPSQISFLIIG
jgi:hypothetical protein